MLAFAIASLVAVLNIGLGLGVLLKHPRSDTHRAFAFLTLIVGLWSITNYFSLVVGNEVDTLFWIRVVMVITSFLGPAVLFLTYSFPRTNARFPRWASIGLLAFSIFTCVLSATPAVFSSVSVVDGVITPTPNWGIAVYALNFLGSLVISFILLVLHLRRATGIAKTQIKYLVFGIISSFTLLATSNFFFVLILHNSSFVVFGPAFTLLFVGFIAYAIVRHRFLDINLVIIRAISYVLVALALGTLVITAIFGLTQVFFQYQLPPFQLFVFTVLSLIIAGLANPLLQLFSRLTKRLFFKSMYDPDDLLQQLGKDTTTTLDLSTMSPLVLKHITEALQVTGASLVIFSPETSKPSGTTQRFQLFSTDARQSFSDAEVEQLQSLLQQNKKSSSHDLIVLEELEESSTKDFLTQHEVNVAVCLSVNQEIIGGLLLSQKLSGEALPQTDLELLELFGPELAIAISNSLSYQEIQHFADRLQEEVKAATKDLQIANERLKELDMLKSEFVSMTSHELRTPLSTIKWFLELMSLDKENPLAKKQNERLADIQKATNGMIELVGSLLNVSRIESGRLKVQPEKVKLPELVSEVEKNVHTYFTAKDQTLTLKLADDLPVLSIDPQLVKRILINLLTNSSKYSEAKTDVTLEMSVKDKDVLVSVADHGIGIPADDQHRVFEKFYRSARTVSIEGNGLGLYLTKKLVEISGGTIWFESKEGTGTTFFFTLPLAGTVAQSGEVSLDTAG